MHTYSAYCWTKEDGDIHASLTRRNTGWPIDLQRKQRNGVAQCVFAYEREETLIANLRSLLRSSNYSHCLFREWCGVGQVYFYVRDQKSPSGVRLAMITEEALADRILIEGKRPGALSPTEGL